MERKCKKMNKEKEYNRRVGRGVKWQMFGEFTVNTGYTIDDLDSKDLSDARSSFEKVFITIRKALETLLQRYGWYR